MSEKEKSQSQEENIKEQNSSPANEEANTPETHSEVEQSMIDESQKEPSNNTNEELNSTSDDDEDVSTAQEASAEKEETSNAHQDELDEAIAEDSEDEDAHERHGIEMKDYHAMSMPELVKELSSLLKNEKVQHIKDHVQEIKSEFDAKFEEEMEQKKEDFLEEGGNIIDFHYSSPIKKEFNSIYFDYKEKRNNHYQQLKNNLQKNLEERLAIIEELKGMIGSGADMGANFSQFKELQERWKKAGPVPRDQYKMVWNTYHHHVENFYDFLHLDREFRDMDFKHNLEQKLKMIARAEELAEETNINRAFRELQMLHKMWKEDVGPVAKEYREDIWEKFSEATKKIHENRQAHFADLDKVKEKNLEVKQGIIEEIKQIADKEITSHNQAQQQIKQIEALRDQFFKAGKVPIKVNEDTWKAFKENVRSFNRKKNAYYKNLKKEQYKNLERKLELVEIAEDNKDNEDFKATTPIMKKIQSNWKQIGHVPRKDSDKIWKRFKEACNHYFDRVHAVRNEENKEENEAFDKKKELLEAAKSLELQGNPEEDLKVIKAKIAEWKEVGRVPFNKRYIEGKFNKILDQLFSQLDIGRKEAEMMKYENRVQALDQADDSRQIEREESFLRKKISETKAEITQLENNMQFFSNADESNPLFREVLKNIERHKVQLETWKAKLKKVKSL